MQDQARLRNFVSATPYTAPVDVKKLKFIYAAIEKFVRTRAREFGQLRILEVACGSGGITLPLVSLGCQVTAFDIDEDSVALLQAKIKERKIGNVTVTVDDGYTFDDENQYDIVVASEVFEHVLEPSTLAGNITKRMKDDALLIMTIPNGYGPWELKNRLNIRTHLIRWNALRKFLGKPLYSKGSGPDHCQFYTRRQILDLLSAFSLRFIDFGKSDSFLTVCSPLRKSDLFGNLDIKLADNLPYWLASGWYFVFELQQSNR